MDRELPVSVWPEWKIIEKIGEGSFGKVYKARRLERNKAFYSAIKIISIPSNQGELKSVRSEMGNDQSVKQYFQNLVEECIQEVSTMEYFRGNSHVVAVEDYKVVEYLDDIGWDIYIRMEYLTGFLEYCSGKQIGEDEVIQLGIDLCKALEYCRKLNIIHRDIKPENIFVSRFGEFKLGDFGIARELERSMSTFSKKGTYSYMAPEMYRGEKYDHRADIYSLGIMLYKLRNRNRLPFLNLEKQFITYRDKENALTRRMSGETLPAPVDAGAGLTEILLKACAYRESDRYSDAAEFRQALEDLKYHRKVTPAAQPEKQIPVYQQAKSEQPAAAQRQVRRIQSKQQQSSPAVQARSSQQSRPERKPQISDTGIQYRPNTAANRKKKKEQPGTGLLVSAVIIMTAAVVILTAIFVKHLLDDSRSTTGSPDETDLVQIIEATDESEKEGLAEDLAVIREHATEISNDLDTPLQWIGTESDGKISYFDTSGQVMKVLIYPSLSEEGLYEEYYYWDGKLFFAYIWTDEDLDEVRASYYYYKDGELIRWIDEANVCHDYETDNEEYNILGERYWNRSVEYIKEFVQGDEEVENGVSD